jgi:hypothetical protein
VVAVGETLTEPEVSGVTEPTLLSIENEVALVVVQESVDAEPVWTEVGEAESVQVGGVGGAGVTVILTEQVIDPSGPVAVPV